MAVPQPVSETKKTATWENQRYALTLSIVDFIVYEYKSGLEEITLHFIEQQSHLKNVLLSRAFLESWQFLFVCSSRFGSANHKANVFH